MDLIAISGLTFSLGDILVGSILGGAIAIVYGDREGRYRQRSRRRAAVATVRLVRRLLRRKITTRYETLYTGGAPGPPEANDVQGIADGGPCADADGADWSGSRGHRRFVQTAF